MLLASQRRRNARLSERDIEQEQIESIIQVYESEIKAKPYVSPSEQILQKEAEEERARLELLVDDFRERALMWMMDGVLEIRWEDIIKLDVRKPACMLEKLPENYTIQDILAVKKYEAEVEALRQDRERYKRMLESDYVKLSGLRQDRIEKFDTKVNDLFEVHRCHNSDIIANNRSKAALF